MEHMRDRKEKQGVGEWKLGFMVINSNLILGLWKIKMMLLCLAR
jgi:hypothetical protein